MPLVNQTIPNYRESALDNDPDACLASAPAVLADPDAPESCGGLVPNQTWHKLPDPTRVPAGGC